MKAERAEQMVASGAWKGGLIEEMIEGVKTNTLGERSSFSLCLLASLVRLLASSVGGGGGCNLAVRMGRKA